MRGGRLAALLAAAVVLAGCVGGATAGDAAKGGPVVATLAHDGFVGALAAPIAADGPVPGLVLLGGSRGGMPLRGAARALADGGVAALSVAMFGIAGLPDELAELPLEPVAAAVDWLAARPEVDPHRIWVAGVSRGSEAALLAVSSLDLPVAGVVASVPSHAVWCSWPDCDRSAWTLAGEPVAYWSPDDRSSPPEAVIPVEEIDAPVVTICGGKDAVWESCWFARLIHERRAHRGATHPDDQSWVYEDAGHAAGWLWAPPGALEAEAAGDVGGTADANRAALADAWPRLLALVKGSGQP